MSKLTKALTAAAGSAGGDSLYVEDVFSTYLYDAAHGTSPIVNGINLADEGGLVWFKNRTSGYSNVLFDTERGIANNLVSNTTAGNATSIGLASFNTNGFSFSGVNLNVNSESHVAWTFRKAEKFFDVVTYTGNGTSNRQIPHNLGSTPGFILIKRTDSTNNWLAWHKDVNPGYGIFDLTSTFTAGANGFFDAVADTYFETSWINTNGATFVAYLFASDAGGFGDDGSENVISCGSYTTDGSATAQYIDLGFEPQFFIKKKTTGADNWEIYDTMRGWSAPNDTYGVSSAKRLYTNLSVAEGATTSSPGPTATGMYFPTGGQSYNATYIYIAIRRPMKTPESGTEVFMPVAYTGNNTARTITAGFPIDAELNLVRNVVAGHPLVARLTGGRDVTTDTAEVESATYASFLGFDNQTGLEFKDATGYSYYNSSVNTYVAYMLKRATGFMDVVAYTGNGAVRTIPHNLGVAPEMMIFKIRNQVSNWQVYASGMGPTKSNRLNNDGAPVTATAYFNDTAPTSSVFTLGTSSNMNWSGNTFISYHFATLAGVSKVGSYTGTGAVLNVDCGFTAGARFILIKRTDSTGDWYTYDSVSGISAGNDPYLLLNTTSAEVTGTDYIDPLSSGFTVTSTAPAGLNANGGTYIFLAIA